MHRGRAKVCSAGPRDAEATGLVSGTVGQTKQRRGIKSRGGFLLLGRGESSQWLSVWRWRENGEWRAAG